MSIFKKFFVSILLVVAFGGFFVGGFYYGQYYKTCPVCQPTELDFSLFWTVYHQLQEKFVNPEKITPQSVLYGAVAGMTSSLDDPYTTFFDPIEAKQFQDQLLGSFEGIGVEIGIKQDQLIVVSPIDGTPGQKAGLRAGDAILKIDGNDTSALSVDKAVMLIRGKKGTEVILSIYRSPWIQSKDIKIIRDTIIISPLEWKMLDNNVAYIRINEFGANLENDFNNMAEEILKQNAQKIILDLRNNPGGYLEVSQAIASWFLEKGKVVVTEEPGQGREPKIYKAEGPSIFSKFPTVVLINEGSASASEILAGALRDNRAIKLIGEKSFGKGSVQQAMQLGDGSMLKVTIAKWLTPNGISISDKGLNPDIKVTITEEDIAKHKDPQLDKAIETIGKLQ